MSHENWFGHFESYQDVSQENWLILSLSSRDWNKFIQKDQLWYTTDSLEDVHWTLTQSRCLLSNHHGLWLLKFMGSRPQCYLEKREKSEWLLRQNYAEIKQECLYFYCLWRMMLLGSRQSDFCDNGRLISSRLSARWNGFSQSDLWLCVCKVQTYSITCSCLLLRFITKQWSHPGC